jgi:TetR/AcrR family transcriptional repressor of multidrug resistance operon
MATDKRQALLAATRYLLAHRGIHGFTIRQVAEQAGVATGTLYLYFKDREQLILEVQRYVCQQVAERLFVAHEPQRPLYEQYCQFSLSLWQLYRSEPEILLCKNQFDHLPPEVMQRQYADLRQVMRPLVDFFHQGRDQGELKDLPDEALFALAFDHYATLALKDMMGLVQVDPTLLAKVIEAGWGSLRR